MRLGTLDMACRNNVVRNVCQYAEIGHPEKGPRRVSMDLAYDCDGYERADREKTARAAYALSRVMASPKATKKEIDQLIRTINKGVASAHDWKRHAICYRRYATELATTPKTDGLPTWATDAGMDGHDLAKHQAETRDDDEREGDR